MKHDFLNAIFVYLWCLFLKISAFFFVISCGIFIFAARLFLQKLAKACVQQLAESPIVLLLF